LAERNHERSKQSRVCDPQKHLHIASEWARNVQADRPVSTCTQY
jgi:hypothetical protein